MVSSFTYSDLWRSILLGMSIIVKWLCYVSVAIFEWFPTLDLSHMLLRNESAVPASYPNLERDFVAPYSCRLPPDVPNFYCGILGIVLYFDSGINIRGLQRLCSASAIFLVEGNLSVSNGIWDWNLGLNLTG